MLLNFDHNELKAYLIKITGYEIESVYSIENNPMWIDTTFNLQENQIIKIAAFCNYKKGFSKFGFTQFMWNQEIKVGNYNKFIRKIK